MVGSPSCWIRGQSVSQFISFVKTFVSLLVVLVSSLFFLSVLANAYNPVLLLCISLNCLDIPVKSTRTAKQVSIIAITCAKLPFQQRCIRGVNIFGNMVTNFFLSNSFLLGFNKLEMFTLMSFTLCAETGYLSLLLG